MAGALLDAAQVVLVCLGGCLGGKDKEFSPGDHTVSVWNYSKPGSTSAIPKPREKFSPDYGSKPDSRLVLHSHKLKRITDPINGQETFSFPVDSVIHTLVIRLSLPFIDSAIAPKGRSED